MGRNNNNSVLSRPAKLPPALSILLGAVSVPLGLLLEGSVGGALIGGGIGIILMGVWDYSRLRYVAWRRSRQLRRVKEDID